MINIKNAIAAGVASIAVMGGATAASAATLAYAQTATTLSGGSFTDTACNTGSRSDLCNVLGAPDGDFVGGIGNGFFSMKNTDQVVLTFGTSFAGSIYIYEVTGGNVNNNVEGLNFTLIAQDFGGNQVAGVFNNMGTKVSGTTARYEIEFASTGGPFTSLIVQDNSGTADGFDLDAIAVSAVPVPAAGLLLLGALGGLGAMRRRKAQKA
ncbi:VPLPA-CTERM sorting domain-containing protein [Loktanella sp. DJP18]|uniref:VPLPA-CTERM sorting domain-containing protein n=1 Tax=Loktanella sp. DJP18 TaxID=3409788 RepID=UPI003BB7B6D8